MHDARERLEKEEEIPFKNLRHAFSKKLALELIAKRLVELENVGNKRGLFVLRKTIITKPSYDPINRCSLLDQATASKLHRCSQQKAQKEGNKPYLLICRYKFYINQLPNQARPSETFTEQVANYNYMVSYQVITTF